MAIVEFRGRARLAFGLWGLSVVVAGTASCSSAEDDERRAPAVQLTPLSVQTERRSLLEPPPADGTMPSSFVDVKGTRWLLRRRVTAYAPSSGETVEPSMPAPTPTTDFRPPRTVEEMTDEELTENFRPVVLVNDHEYVAELPSNFADSFRTYLSLAKQKTAPTPAMKSIPVESVQLLDNASAIGHIGHGTYHNTSTTDPPQSVVSDLQLVATTSSSWRPARLALRDGKTPNPTNLLQPQLVAAATQPWLKSALRDEVIPNPTDLMHPLDIWPADTRAYVPQNLVHLHPYRTKVALSNSPDDTANRCTATMVGRATMATAAHCLYSCGQGWRSPRRWSIGSATWYEGFTKYWTHTWGPTTGGYIGGVPQGFINHCNSPNDVAYWDFAWMDFWTGYPPYIGDVSGWTWLGQSVTDVDYQTAWSWMDGFSGAAQPGGPYYYVFPTVVTRAEQYLNSVYVPIAPALNHWLDTAGGDSGACVIQDHLRTYGDYTYYCVGIHRGGPHYPYPPYTHGNTARRVDATYVYFLYAYTQEW